MSTKASLAIKYDTQVLTSLCDHVVQTTHLHLGLSEFETPAPSNQPAFKVIYKWVEGNSVHDYADSAVTWKSTQRTQLSCLPSVLQWQSTWTMRSGQNTWRPFCLLSE